MRLIFYLVVGVIVLTLLRSVLEAIGKAFSGGPSPQAAPAEPPRGQAPQSLKKDPVCGTFVSMATAMQKTKGGETYYFCSAACRDKF
jgi:YHS domain-containing protein